MLEILIEYRYLIWVIGGALTYWLMVKIPSWQRVARGGMWGAERDYAMWRVRRALMLLAVLVPLLVTTTAAVFRL